MKRYESDILHTRIAKMLNGKLVKYDFAHEIPVNARQKKSYHNFRPIGMGYIFSLDGIKQVYRGMPTRYVFYKKNKPSLMEDANTQP